MLLAVVAGIVLWQVGGTGGRAASTTPAAAAGTAASAHTPLAVRAIKIPGNGRRVAGTTPITVTFSAPLAALPTLPIPAIPQTNTPRITPAVAGLWRRTSATTLMFVPRGSFMPSTRVSVSVPNGPDGIRAADGSTMSSPASAHFTVAEGSPLRLQQLLAQLGYLPLSFRAGGGEPAAGDPAAQARAIFSPPAGTFSWRHTGWPSSLTAMWHAGASNMITRGALIAFQAKHGMTMDGVAGPHVWSAVLKALAGRETSTSGYDYALASESSPESLTVWHEGHVVVSTPANTGIPGQGTGQGTFPVYERLQSQVMQGTNPGGSHYSDPVQWVAYFNGGEAVHYIPRADYGSPQSLGCIEVPLGAAARAWPYLTYGTLVTVSG